MNIDERQAPNSAGKHSFATPSALLDAIGRQFGPTAWLEISQDRIDGFADATGDHQWIHTDVARAQTSSFGATIAHGYLTLSLFSALLPELFEVRGCGMMLNAGLNRVRFITPVRAGGRVRAIAELTSAKKRGLMIEIVLSVTVELEGAGRPACVLEPVIRITSAS